MNKKISLTGFTLLETLVYILLLGFIMTGALLATYQILDGAGKLDTSDTTEQEGEFVLGKINWVLGSVFAQSDISVPAPGTYGTELSVVREDGISVVIKKVGTQIEMSENGAAFVPLTSSNVAVSAFTVHAIPSQDMRPAGIEATTTINGVTFTTKRYVGI